jgi:hypothetical protein
MGYHINKLNYFALNYNKVQEVKINIKNLKSFSA